MCGHQAGTVLPEVSPREVRGRGLHPSHHVGLLLHHGPGLGPGLSDMSPAGQRPVQGALSSRPGYRRVQDK